VTVVFIGCGDDWDRFFCPVYRQRRDAPPDQSVTCSLERRNVVKVTVSSAGDEPPEVGPDVGPEVDPEAPGAEAAPEAVLLLAPRDGTPTPITTDAELAAAAARFAAGTGPVAVDAERASGYRYTHRAYRCSCVARAPAR
jgi:hypothetical protein